MPSDTAAPVAPKPGLIGKIALLLTGAMSGIANGTLAPILPEIENEFGAGSGFTTITMTLTITGLGILLGSLLGGWAADKIGRRFVMVVSGALFAIGGCGVMLAGSLLDVIIGRLIAGAALGAMGAAAFAVIGDCWDEHGRNVWSGLLGGLGAGAAIVFSVAAGIIADDSWRASFIIYAIGLIAAACALLGIVSSTKVGEKTDEGRIPMSILPGLLIFGLLAGAISTGTAAYLPHRFVETGVDTSTLRALLGLPAAVTVTIVSFSYGFFRKFISLEMAFILAATLSCIGLLIMALGESPYVVSAGLGLEGVGLGLLMPSLVIYAINKSNEDNRGRMIGLVKGSVFAGPFLIQFGLDPLRMAEGTGAVMLTLAASAAALAGWFVYVAMRNKAAQKPPIDDGAPGVLG